MKKVHSSSHSQALSMDGIVRLYERLTVDPASQSRARASGDGVEWRSRCLLLLDGSSFSGRPTELDR